MASERPPDTPRPNLDDVRSGRLRAEDLKDRGYLSWEEMRRMISEGYIEIQGHETTHTWYPCGSRILDFDRPTGVDGYIPPPWLAWNRFPERKHDSLTARLEDLIPYGTPVFECGKSLSTRRYFEDPYLSGQLVGSVADRGGAAFFGQQGWRQELHRVVKVIIRNTDPEFFIAALEKFARARKSLWTMRRHKLRYMLRYYLTGKT